MIILGPLQKAAALCFTVVVVGMLMLAWIVTAPLLRWGMSLHHSYNRPRR